eukprot:TRINITY_DN13316_c0_g1_i10.p1 TRINITY_DN13316_c0_g1~~TRINITY_DN13316_c0_g1_i10.p1  ORF type:complete len:519 (-),score=117.05 TRINITY_DN13316_c0_g1_i10:167-1723(-)
MPLYPPASAGRPQYAPLRRPFAPPASSIPSYLPQGNYQPVYPGSEYLSQTAEQPRAEFSYPNYGREFAKPPGIGTYPMSAAPANTYAYPYAQADSMYGYVPRAPRAPKYYMPPRPGDWSLPSYKQSDQYYSGPSSLRAMNAPRYQPVDYRNQAAEYRPRAVSAPYNAFLENFKQKLTYAKKMDIEELRGHMLELAKDQFGSRHLQQRIQENVPEEKEIIYKELKPYVSELMIDAFGNYVIQMLIQYGLPKQRDELIAAIIKNAKHLAFDMCGCRCMQKALSVGNREQSVVIVKELKDNVAECVENQHANHVLQKCIECLNGEEIGFLLEYARENVMKMSCHIYGCRIMQKVVEKLEVPETEVIIGEIIKQVAELSQNQYGNYVVQHVLQYGKPQHKEKVILHLKDQLLYLSRQKFSSNVIEKCFQFVDEKLRDQLLLVMLGREGDPNPPLYDMMRDKFANYVVQKAVEVTGPPLKETLIGRVLAIPDRNNYTQHVFNAVTKLSSSPVPRGRVYTPYTK